MKEIKLNEEVYVSKKEALAEITKASKGKSKLTNQADIPFMVGGKYYIRTVTYHATGEVDRVVGKFLVLKDAAWIADSGRFREAIMSGVLNEVEPVDVEMYLNIDSIVDAFEWSADLPRDQK